MANSREEKTIIRGRGLREAVCVSERATAGEPNEGLLQLEKVLNYVVYAMSNSAK